MSKNAMHDGTATASRPGTGNTPARRRCAYR